MPESTLTVKKLMTAVMKNLQSKDETQLDVGLSVDVITIRRPVGAGKRKLMNISVDRFAKQSILAMSSDDELLCCAKAIVFALAHLENDCNAIASLKRSDRPALKNRTRALHEEARVPLGPCTFREIV